MGGAHLGDSQYKTPLPPPRNCPPAVKLGALLTHTHARKIPRAHASHTTPAAPRPFSRASLDAPPTAAATSERTMPSPDLLRVLCDPTRPCFTFGCTPPREGTTEAEARRICAAYAARSAALATDGFVIYSLVDESVRTALPRPFPFRATMDAALFASYFFAAAEFTCSGL